MITGRINQIAFTFFSKNHEKTLAGKPTAARRESAVRTALPREREGGVRACRKERRETAAWGSDEVTAARRGKTPSRPGLVRIRRSSEAERERATRRVAAAQRPRRASTPPRTPSLRKIGAARRDESPRARDPDEATRAPPPPRYCDLPSRERRAAYHRDSLLYRTGQSVPLRRRTPERFDSAGKREVGTKLIRPPSRRPTIASSSEGTNERTPRRRSTVSIEPWIVNECAVTGRVSDANAPPPSDRFVACGKLLARSEQW
ncbi:MAG: hypothetical protein KAG97_04925 [Victivallales bacterium]|nr:hypothetical protein [Victivallales bacterium]